MLSLLNVESSESVQHNCVPLIFGFCMYIFNSACFNHIYNHSTKNIALNRPRSEEPFNSLTIQTAVAARPRNLAEKLSA